MTKQSRLKTIIYSALITLTLWAGDQAIKGVGDLETATVRAATKSYENYRFPVAKIPEKNYG